MDPLNAAMTLIIACFVFVLVVEVLSDVLDVILYGFIAIAAAGGIVHVLYVKVIHPAYLACRRFISEHPFIFVAIVLAALALVLAIISLWIESNIRRLLTTDYTELIYQCDQDIARVTESLTRARAAEKNYRLCNEFEILEPGRHKYGYNPNRFEREVDKWEDTLNRLEDDKQYYEEQRRKANIIKLRH